jgi:hypothetical protein
MPFYSALFTRVCQSNLLPEALLKQVLSGRVHPQNFVLL